MHRHYNPVNVVAVYAPTLQPVNVVAVYAPTLQPVNVVAVYAPTLQPVNVVAVYAPTLQTCERDPSKRDKIYNQIEAIIDKTPKRDVIFIAGDFNAKVGSQQNDNPTDCIGLYGKVKYGMAKEN